MNWTFSQWKHWANGKFPGAGDQFITWVQNNNNVPPPYILTLSSNSFGPTGFGKHNMAADWFAAWMLLGQVGPGIGKALKIGIVGSGKDIQKELKGTAIGTGNNPIGAVEKHLSGLEAIGHFFDNLSQREFWIRIAEVGLGAALIIIGVAAIAPNTKAGKTAGKIVGSTFGLAPGVGIATKSVSKAVKSVPKPAPKPAVKPAVKPELSVWER